MRLAIEKQPALARLAQEKRESLARSVRDCKAESICFVQALLLSEAEIASAREGLEAVYSQEPALAAMLDRDARNSGLFQRYHTLPAKQLLSKAWLDAANGMNQLIRVYGAGDAPRYPEIDSASYDVKAANYTRLLHIILAAMDEDGAAVPLFFQPTLRFGLQLLDANGRYEAGRFEPMERGENAAAYRQMANLKWDRYPYSVIVVPGSGTDRMNVAFSPWGKVRTALAARRFREGKAPLILVSGGYVHPKQTPHCEALEMKKALMREYGIPEEAILIDPHARHTTTNLRNAARLLYRYGAPMEKKGLITTDLYQSQYIEAAGFAERCLKELGYLPHKLLGRISPSDLEFLPLIDSLHADSIEPLDP